MDNERDRDPYRSGIGRDLYGISIALTIRSLDPSLSAQLIAPTIRNTHAPFLN